MKQPQPQKTRDPKFSPEEKEALDRSEEVRKNARRIADQILNLTRNGLFVYLRFLDVALCQFEYISTDQISDDRIRIKDIATTGEHVIFDPKYIIEQYMQDKQRLSRDYLHMVLHCIFRHPFVSENLNEEYWNLATDIAVENIICDLDVNQTRTRNAGEIESEIKRIRGIVRQVTAEHLYQYLLSGAASEKDMEKWRKLFYRDDHRIWWEIAKQIAEAMERKKQKEAEQDKPAEDSSELPDQEENEEEQQDSEEGEEDGESGEEFEDGEGSEDENSDGEEFADGDEESESEEQDDENSEDSEDEEDQDESEDGDQDGDSEEEGEDEFEEEFQDEYSSTPGQSMQRENENDLADPDSDTRESGKENNDDGSGGGKPGEDSEQSEDEGTERKNDMDTDGLEGKNEEDRKQSDEKPENNLSGKADEGKRDDSPDNDPFADDEQKSNSQNVEGQGGKSRNSSHQQGEHTAGTGGGGDGTQSAWEHSSGGAAERGDGDRNDENRRQLDGEIDPEDEQEISSDDRRRQEAQATEGTQDAGEHEREPSLMHDGDERQALEDKWKEISERMLVDLETSSKEWGDKSDAMLQGIKKINRDKYDYSSFLRKFSTMREDIQINDDEFDYVYYTLGLERYGNIPLIEPLEYKEVRKVRDFVIAIDTSGSCSGEVVQKFLDKTYSIFTQQENFFRKINLHIIQCDAEIQSDVKITCKQEFDDYMKNLEFKGFGGTDFRPVFEYVGQMIEHNEFDDLKGMIYFTDGNGTYPKRRPPYETAFVFVDDDEFEYEVPSWAMKLVLETNDITEEVLI